MVGIVCGNNIPLIRFHSDKPSALPASLCACDILQKAFFILAVKIGKLKIVKASEPAKIEKPILNI